MTRAQVHSGFGPPEVMEWREHDVPDPGPGEVRIRHTAIGVNFADTYHRSGVPHPWPVPPPCVIGFEAAGIVEAVGDGDGDFTAGQRVAYGIPPLGAYAEARNYPADKLLHLPDGLDDRTVAAMLMKGMTAQYPLADAVAAHTAIESAATTGASILIVDP